MNTDRILRGDPTNAPKNERLVRERLNVGSHQRFCYYINSLHSTEGGFIPCAVFEGESGYSLMSGDPAKLQTPWVWGPSLEDAEAVCREANKRLGHTDHDVVVIIASSMKGRAVR